MKKIIIIGCPGAGKSVFSRKLARVTHLPLIHLDMIFHNSDGTHISKEEFNKKLSKVLVKERWIIDGNYQSSLEMRLKACDTVFLLDFPTEVCLEGAKARVGQKRDDMPWFETELQDNFKQKILNFEHDKLPEIYDLLDEYKEGKNILIFKSRKEADEYIDKLANESNKEH